MDRASGSGVFARDADALLDLTQVKNKGDEDDSTIAMRVEGTLREFAPFQPFVVSFKYPLHYLDEQGEYSEAKAEGESKGTPPRIDIPTQLENAFDCLSTWSGSDYVMIGQLEEFFNASRNTVKKYIDKSTVFNRNKDGKVSPINQAVNGTDINLTV
jgi:hypothetical protein